jgi:hypothetical protein
MGSFGQPVARGSHVTHNTVIFCQRRRFNEKTSFYPLPGRAEIEQRTILKMYEFFIYGDVHIITGARGGAVG